MAKEKKEKSNNKIWQPFGAFVTENDAIDAAKGTLWVSIYLVISYLVVGAFAYFDTPLFGGTAEDSWLGAMVCLPIVLVFAFVSYRWPTSTWVAYGVLGWIILEFIFRILLIAEGTKAEASGFIILLVVFSLSILGLRGRRYLRKAKMTEMPTVS